MGLSAFATSWLEQRNFKTGAFGWAVNDILRTFALKRTSRGRVSPGMAGRSVSHSFHSTNRSAERRQMFEVFRIRFVFPVCHRLPLVVSQYCVHAQLRSPPVAPS
jgi:hypothetical protein